MECVCGVVQVRVLALPDGSLYEGGLKILMDANMNATRSPQDGVVSVSDSGQVTFDVQYPTSVDDGLPGFNASTQHLIVPKVTYVCDSLLFH